MKVSDNKPTVEVNVTDKDITHGLRGSPTGCPVALALIRTLYEEGIKAFVLIEKRNITLTTACRKMYTFPLPEEGCFFVNNYDNYKRVQPFKFKLTLREELKDETR